MARAQRMSRVEVLGRGYVLSLRKMPLGGPLPVELVSCKKRAELPQERGQNGRKSSPESGSGPGSMRSGRPSCVRI
jgi:hypothetical protein